MLLEVRVFSVKKDYVFWRVYLAGVIGPRRRVGGGERGFIFIYMYSGADRRRTANRRAHTPIQ